MADKNKTQKLITLERVLGSEIFFQPTQLKSFNQPSQLCIASPYLHSELVNFFQTSEQTIFKTEVDVNRLVKYSDGSVSSMIKGVKGISGHKGFEVIESMELANELFLQIGRAFNNAVADMYNSYVEEINSEINNVYQQFELHDFSKLKSISFFIKEVYSDIDESGLNKEQSQATLTNIQKYRIDLRELLYKYLELIRSNISPWQNLIPINSLASNYLSCRFCISLYTTALVAETILSNRLDDSGLESLKRKVSNVIEEFNHLTHEVNRNLENRFYNNKQQIENSLRWAYDQLLIQQKHNENTDLNNFASDHLFDFSKEIELEKIEELLNERKKLLSNVTITK